MNLDPTHKWVHFPRHLWEGCLLGDYVSDTTVYYPEPLQ